MSSREKFEYRREPWVLILGAGMSGLSVAAALDDYLADNNNNNSRSFKCVMVDQHSEYEFPATLKFMFASQQSDNGDGKNSNENVNSNGSDDNDHLICSYHDLTFKHITYIQDAVYFIDVDQHIVRAKGHTFYYDKLVLCLGLQKNYFDIKPDSLKDVAFDVSSFESMEQLKDALLDYDGLGCILLCLPAKYGEIIYPAAIFELALMLKSYIAHHRSANNQQGRSVITVTTTEQTAYPSDDVARILEANGIKFIPNIVPLHIDRQTKRIVYHTGAKIAYELLITQFPAKIPDLLVRSGLASTATTGVYTNSDTSRTKITDVYCIGDCADTATKLPRNGAIAINKAVAVAYDIIRSSEEFKISDRMQASVDATSKKEAEENRLKQSNAWNMNEGIEVGKEEPRAVFYIATGNNTAASVEINQRKDLIVKMAKPDPAHFLQMKLWFKALKAKWFQS